MSNYKPNRKIPCVYMRGGTSKAVFFRDEDLPQDAKERDKVILKSTVWAARTPRPVRWRL